MPLVCQAARSARSDCQLPYLLPPSPSGSKLEGSRTSGLSGSTSDRGRTTISLLGRSETQQDGTAKSCRASGEDRERDEALSTEETFRAVLRCSLMARFSILGQIRHREVIATGKRIKELGRLQSVYGRGNWRKCKGRATVQYGDGRIREAEVHWYEAHGIGRQEVKIKRHLD